MKFLVFFMLSFYILSCDTVEEKYLYKPGDKEYGWAQEIVQAECITESSVFNALETAGDFTNSDQENRIYKVVQDDGPNVTLYIKIISVSTATMELAVRSGKSEYNKILIFDKVDHDALISELKNMSCNPAYKDYFSASGLDSSDSMNLTWKKETIGTPDSEDDDDIEPDVYDRRTDSYKITKTLPLIFFYYNGTKKSDRVTEKGQAKVEESSILTITEVTNEKECNITDSDFTQNCNFTDNSDLTMCDVNVIPDSYKTHAYSSEMITVTPKTTGICNLLKSAE